MSLVVIDDIRAAQERLGGVAFVTPLAPSPHLGKLVGAKVWLKLENLQRTGSFKLRGAFNRLSQLAGEHPGAAVAAASAGNHAQGVAVSAAMLGLKAVIFMPRGASLSKRQATAGAGAEVRLTGESVADCLEAARALEPGHVFIHPYDDPAVIAGQGSLGLEIMAQLPDAEALLVPVGGGGLIAGVATAVKAVSPATLVIGVAPAAAPAASAALAAGGPRTIATRPTLADGARIARIGDENYPLIARHVDRVVTVEEEYIAQAMLLLLERRRIVAEGAGALGLAALLSGSLPELAGKRVVILISGGNVDSNLLGRIIDQGLARSGRIWRFAVVLPDRPGALAALLTDLARREANVLTISHDRLGRELASDHTLVRLELETLGFEHAAQIAADLAAAGHTIREEP
ncbi:MAG: threonine ammonia-lyase [Thermodesulfobacteriota bacterium]